MAVGESRTELLAWLNSTLALLYAKVEQCGTGAAYCQLMDSIYGGVALSRVKFDAQLSDYDARNNMKVLQAEFNKHGISKPIEVERLIRCRLQDNLELLQWFKRHWMDNKDVNVHYDAVARRQGKPGPASGPSSRRSTLTSGRASGSSSRGSRVSSHSSPSVPAAAAQPKRRVASSTFPQTAQSALGGPSEQRLSELASELSHAREELNEYRVLTDSLETERNFYFNKLREIEILTQNIQDHSTRDDAAAKHIKQMSVLDLVEQIQAILYTTEKGFEVQDDTDAVSF